MTGERHAFEYAVVRVVPRIERGECLNAGVVVYCRRLDYLGARVELDLDRLRALDPAADPAPIEDALAVLTAICAGRTEAGPASGEALGARFRWLTAPRSTVVQTGPVHTGLTADPSAEVARLLDVLVRPIRG